MKTKIILMYGCMMAAVCLAGYQAPAQSMQAVKPEYISGTKKVAEFTWKIFQAPNKMYGYDIFKNNKFIHHQPASFTTQDNSTAALSTKEQAGKAALFAIEKIKKGQPAQLSQDEIKKILAR